MGPLGTYMLQLRDRVSSLPEAQTWAFGVASLERQWPIYARAAEGRPWDHRPELRGVLDRLWAWVAGGQRPHGILDICEQAQFVDYTGERPDLEYELQNDGEGAAADVIVGFISLAEVVASDEPEECYYVAQKALDLVQAFVYDYELPHLAVGSDSDVIVDQHELVRNAVRQQEDDLALITSTTDVPAIGSQLKTQASSAGILLHRWYS